MPNMSSQVLEALNVLVENGLTVAEVLPIINDLFEADAWDDEDDKKFCALAYVCDELEVEQTYDDCSFSAGGAEYMVLTESEREERWDESLENYLDDCGVEGADSPYFDRERWKRDARMDGAGHALSSYDGNEEEYAGKDEWFFIYRTN
jgi:hypothetical protein